MARKGFPFSTPDFHPLREIHHSAGNDLVWTADSVVLGW